MNILRPTLNIRLPDVRIGVSAYIGWELYNSRTGIVERSSGRLWPNLITNVGLDAIGSAAAGAQTNRLDNLFLYCGVGTDNTPPVNGDTDLHFPVGTRVISDGGFPETSGAAPDNAYVWRRFYRVFLEGNANGNLTEVMMFPDIGGVGVGVDRQLLKDDLGEPTTIVKTVDYQLRVIVEYRVYGMLIPDTALGVVISGNNYDLTTKQIGYVSARDYLGQWGVAESKAVVFEQNTLPAFGANFGGSGGASGALSSLAAYGGGNYYRDIEWVFEPAVGNFASGIGGLAWNPVGQPVGAAADAKMFASIFSPRIPKTSLQRLRIVSRMSWTRV